jgi:hypothetical protein
MERDVLEVFGERDSGRRKLVINELYAENCTFFEGDDQIVGNNALNAKVGQILKEAPGFAFHLAGQAEVNHEISALIPIYHQPFQSASVNSDDPQTVINNVVGLAKVVSYSKSRRF